MNNNQNNNNINNNKNQNWNDINSGNILNQNNFVENFF